MDCQVCDNQIYQCVLDPYSIQWDVEPEYTWIHAASVLDDLPDPIGSAVRLDTDHQALPY